MVKKRFLIFERPPFCQIFYFFSISLVPVIATFMLNKNIFSFLISDIPESRNHFCKRKRELFFEGRELFERISYNHLKNKMLKTKIIYLLSFSFYTLLKKHPKNTFHHEKRALIKKVN